MTTHSLENFLGRSPAISSVREEIRRFLLRCAHLRRPPTLLVQGETGTGKGLVVSLLRHAGIRRAGPVVAVNCAAIPEPLLEAELFGFERGAFTDARQAKPGLLEAAHGGTLFLDEVALLPTTLQAKLLTFLDDRHVRRLGATRSRAVDIWLVAATNVDLAIAVKRGQFREDLYHRISVVSLRLPPLRERGLDILLLANAFLAQTATDYGLPHRSLSDEARRVLLAYEWPGNVRQLANIIERTALLTDGETITSDDLGLSSPGVNASFTQNELDSVPASSAREDSVRHSVKAFESRQILKALEQAKWNVSKAAEALGLPRTSLRYRIAKLRLQRAGVSADRSAAR